tara:strand:- start:298 stop:549 length:252 start_codon:yes stop_codon:yes gene_type:complete
MVSLTRWSVTMEDHPKIEKDIPMPIRNGNKKWGWLDKLEVGDSFVVADDSIASVRNAASRRKIKVASRIIKEAPKEFRVWRTG